MFKPVFIFSLNNKSMEKNHHFKYHVHFFRCPLFCSEEKKTRGKKRKKIQKFILFSKIVFRHNKFCLRSSCGRPSFIWYNDNNRLTKVLQRLRALEQISRQDSEINQIYSMLNSITGWFTCLSYGL